MNRTLTCLLALVILIGLAGCESDPTTPPTGNVNLLLTDAPIDLSDVTAVNVTLSEIVLYPIGEDPDGIPVPLAPIADGAEITLNLLDFQNGATIVIGGVEAPAGSYDKLRMRVVEANLERDDDGDPDTPDLVEPIFVPSGKVDIPVAFDLAPGEELDVVLDFDAALSVQVNETGGQHPYILRPGINVSGVHSR